MTADRAKTPICPSCGKPMHLSRIIPGIGGLLELRVYSCRECGVSLTEAEPPGEPAARRQRPANGSATSPAGNP